MKTIVAGSRSILSLPKPSQVKHVARAINYTCQTYDFKITEIISGMAPGVDRLGAEYGRKHGIKVIEMPADWDQYKKRAGFIRNEQMARYADFLIAIWDGASKGTMHMINIMQRLGKHGHVYYIKTKDSPIPL